MFQTKRSNIPLIKFGEEATYTFLETGDIYEFKRSHFLMNQLSTGLIEEAIHNIYLRVHAPGEPIRIYPLIGQASKSRLSCGKDMLRFESEAEGVSCQVDFLPMDVAADDPDVENVWFWRVVLEGEGQDCDLVSLQDIGVADIGALRSNILYQSQYLGHHVYEGEQGYSIASRQNMDQGGSYPMLQQGCLDAKVVGYATDAFQVFGRASRTKRCPIALYQEMLPNEVYQYELSCIGLQTERFVLHGRKQVTFYGYFMTDCQDPDSQAPRMRRAASLYGSLNAHEADLRPVAKLHQSALIGAPYASGTFDAEALDRYFPDRKLEEKDEDGLLSFFLDGHKHVVLQEKDQKTERIHGHILISLPNEKKVDKELLTVTNYMHGVFATQLAVGNVDSNPLLDVMKDTLNLHTRQGLRIFLKMDGTYHMLTMPAAYEMGLNYAKWYYRLPSDLLVVTSFVAAEENAYTLKIESESGKEYEFLLRLSLALGMGGVDGSLLYEEAGGMLKLRPTADRPCAYYYPELEYTLALQEGEGEFASDGVFYEDGVDRDVSSLAVKAKGGKLRLLVRGVLGEKEIAPAKLYCRKEEEAKYLKFYHGFLGGLTLEKLSGNGAERMNELTYWFLHDALIHFAVPHGLEQSGGAAWGTRDVCQGPIELFLTTGHFELARETLLEIYAHQNDWSGEWPQYFMFDRYPYAAGDCHGDVVFWPLKALGDYLEATGDVSLLSASVPYRESALRETVLEHVKRAVANVESRFLKGTCLVNYAGGDWDDTLQPAREEWKEKLCSAWTQALACQVMEILGNQLKGASADMAGELSALAEAMKKDFMRYLVKDGVIAGFILMDSPEEVHYLLHPLDEETGVKYRLLPLTRSIIAGIADEGLAQKNRGLIAEHLDFPDGVRLMNRPTKYRGGNSLYFKRAEQAANVGREIGLLYVHAHVRYLEALARLGEGSELWKGLLKVNPILIQESVPSGRRRQSNAYFSSSDADFKDRYEFSERFEELRTGQVGVKGGWKVYSSGPGIYLARYYRDLLGIRVHADGVVLNPALPVEAKEVCAHITLWGVEHTLRYIVGKEGCGICKVMCEGHELAVPGMSDLYRPGGAFLTKDMWLSQPEEFVLYTF